MSWPCLLAHFPLWLDCCDVATSWLHLLMHAETLQRLARICHALFAHPSMTDPQRYVQRACTQMDLLVPRTDTITASWSVRIPTRTTSMPPAPWQRVVNRRLSRQPAERHARTPAPFARPWPRPAGPDADRSPAGHHVVAQARAPDPRGRRPRRRGRGSELGGAPGGRGADDADGMRPAVRAAG